MAAAQRTSAALREALSQWEKGQTLAPLTRLQNDTVMDLRSVVEDRPLPDLPDTLAEHGASSSASAAAAADGALSPQTTSSVLPEENIETSRQFFLWFDQVEAQQERAQETSFRAYVDALKRCSDNCGEVLAEIDSAFEHLKGLEGQYTSVSTKTTSLHDACEQLLQEQQGLVKVAESVQAHLRYFNELQVLSKKLNSPTLSVVSDQFVPVLEKVDDCVKYLRAHTDFHDAATFTARFEQLQARGLNLIKHYVIQTLKTATQSVMSQLQGADHEASFTLFYGKFRLHAPRIKALADEIDKRKAFNPEYASLLEDCFHCYFAQRLTLLTPSTATAISQMQQEHKTSIARFVRAGCAHLSRVCSNEYQLFHHFFSQTHPGLDGMLEDLCTVFYEACRPLFLAASLDVLVELCAVLKVETLDDNKGDEYAAFINVGEQMLQDVQQRLVYKAQICVQTDIRGFKPQPRDLDYPDRLHEQRKRKQERALAPKSEDGVTSPAGVDPEIYASWYPTLSRSLFLLSKLYRSVDRKVCAGVAQEITASCTSTLTEAFKLIQAKAGPRHAQLFLIRHLLILREEIAPFDVDFSVTELNFDFSNVKEAMALLYKQRSKLLSLDSNNVLLGLLLDTAPNVKESLLDSRRQVDEELKMVCQSFIRDVSKDLTARLKSFCARVHTLPPEKHAELSQQPWGAPDRVRAVVQEAEQDLRQSLPELGEQLAAYLDNSDTERILFHPIRVAVMDAFKDLAEVVERCYLSSADRDIVACPTQTQLALLVTLDQAKPRATAGGGEEVTAQEDSAPSGHLRGAVVGSHSSAVNGTAATAGLSNGAMGNGDHAHASARPAAADVAAAGLDGAQKSMATPLAVASAPATSATPAANTNGASAVPAAAQQ